MFGKLWQSIAVAVVFTMNSNTLFGRSRANILQATLGETGKTPEISTEQMRAILRDGTALVLDTRSRAEFDAGHIPGARNLDAAPAAQLAAVETLVQRRQEQGAGAVLQRPLSARRAGASASSLRTRASPT